MRYNKRIVVIPSTRMCSRRRFESGQVHLSSFGYIVQVGQIDSESIKYEVDSRYIHHLVRDYLVGPALVIDWANS